MRLSRFFCDRRGVAAVEFALIAPILILSYCGLAELSIAMMAERRAAHSASVVADLVAQSGAVTPTTLADIYTVGNAIMTPFPSSALKMRITSVTADVNAIPKVAWSNGNGLAPLTKTNTVSGFPANFLAAGDSVIQADVEYTFTSPLQYIIPAPVVFKDTYYLKPRQGGAVICAAC